MCSIVGYVSDKKAHSLDPALASIHHRGPDAQGSQTSPGSGLHFSEKKNHTYRLVQLLHLNTWLGLNSAEAGKS